MAQSFTTVNGTLIIPSAKASWTVETANGGVSTSGAVMLVGESDAGPDYTLEEDLSLNTFGPDQLAEVVAKYGSGNIVDAFRVASAPSNDPAITGSPSQILIAKTNKSVRASALLYNNATISRKRWLADNNLGKTGNLTNFKVVAAQAEIVPTTGAFTFIPPVGTVNAYLRYNGHAVQTITMAANQVPTSLVSAIDAFTGVNATGGAQRAVIPSISGSLSVTVPSGNNIVINYTGVWTTIPSLGDTLTIPSISVLATDDTDGVGPDIDKRSNAGAYLVTSATTNSVSATKLSDAGQVSPSPTPGAITPPVPVSASFGVVGSTDEFQVFSPITISVDAAIIDGVGKTLEIAELTTGSDKISRTAFVLGTTTPVSWISATGAGNSYVGFSAAEYIAELDLFRSSDNIQEEIVAGGEIGLELGYVGTDATIAIDGFAGTIRVVTTGGVSPVTLDLLLTDYPTIGDLAGFLATIPGFVAVPGSLQLAQLPTTALDDSFDRVTGLSAPFHFATTWGGFAGLIKMDGYRFFQRLSEGSSLVRLQDMATDPATVIHAGSGLPAATSTTYLANGAKGPTLQADVIGAIDALENVRGNFLVPLFSRDASLDKLDRLTDTASTYEVDSINAYCRTHVTKMSTFKRGRPRQTLVSKKDTFANVKLAAADLASFRVNMTFQDVKSTGSDGLLKQFQPWMGAVDAAGMQGAGFYRAIVNKLANLNGVVQAAKDFNDQNDSHMEQALLAGLLPLARAQTGGFRWVSDQTTYGKDNNSVLNSLQAVYASDLISSTTAQRMETAFVGASVADVNANIAMTYFQAIMSDFLRLKLIAPSDDAPNGYKNAKIKLSGTSIVVSAEVKVAGTIYFIPISFAVSQVQQTA